MRNAGLYVPVLLNSLYKNLLSDFDNEIHSDSLAITKVAISAIAVLRVPDKVEKDGVSGVQYDFIKTIETNHNRGSLFLAHKSDDEIKKCLTDDIREVWRHELLSIPQAPGAVHTQKYLDLVNAFKTRMPVGCDPYLPFFVFAHRYIINLGGVKKEDAHQKVEGFFQAVLIEFPMIIEVIIDEWSVPEGSLVCKRFVNDFIDFQVKKVKQYRNRNEMLHSSLIDHIGQVRLDLRKTLDAKKAELLQSKSDIVINEIFEDVIYRFFVSNGKYENTFSGSITQQARLNMLG